MKSLKALQLSYLNVVRDDRLLRRSEDASKACPRSIADVNLLSPFMHEYEITLMRELVLAKEVRVQDRLTVLISEYFGRQGENGDINHRKSPGLDKLCLPWSEVGVFSHLPEDQVDGWSGETQGEHRPENAGQLLKKGCQTQLECVDQT